MAVTHSQSQPEHKASLRKLVIILGALESVVFLYFVIGGLADILPFAKGYGGVAAGLAVIVFSLFTAPALILAAMNRLIGVAAALAILGLVCYLYDPMLRLFALFD